MLRPALQLRLGQSLTMTPQLQQAIRLLQLPVLELNAQIQDALEENVMLEMEDIPDVPSTGAETITEVAVISQEETWQEGPTMERGGIQDSSWSGEGRPMSEYADRSGESLREHLLWQLDIESFTPREFVIGEAIIDAINDDGYLRTTADDILDSLANQANLTLEDVERTLDKVQRFDPVGIGARTIPECILLQLRQLDPDTPGLALSQNVATHDLDLVGEKDYAALRRNHRVNDEELDLALALVRSCHPKPGLAVNSGAAEYVIPDVFIRKVDGQWIVEVSSSGIPRLTVNQHYAQLLRGSGDHSALRAQLQEARWLVRSLEIRNDTLMKVANSIVERQIDFFDQGEEAMKPMVLRDVAEAIEMHESTISRVTTNKYMHTPRGIFEFKYFFSSHLASVDGEDQSSTAVRAKIRKLIGTEDPAKPLSDNKITSLLEEQGIKVARRTVAKYREAMNITSSSERKVRKPR